MQNVKFCLTLKRCYSLKKGFLIFSQAPLGQCSGFLQARMYVNRGDIGRVQSATVAESGNKGMRSQKDGKSDVVDSNLFKFSGSLRNYSPVGSGGGSPLSAQTQADIDEFEARLARLQQNQVFISAFSIYYCFCFSNFL